MPDPKAIKTVNSAAFAFAIDQMAADVGLKPATIAGAAISVYVSTMLDMADKDGVELVHRNLDRAIEMLQTMRSAPNAKAMEARAATLAAVQNAAVHAADDKRREEAKKLMELFAWVGEDEFGSGEVGLKQGIVPAGVIPLVAINPGKLTTSNIIEQMQALVNQYKKERRLVRFVEDETRVVLRPNEQPPTR